MVRIGLSGTNWTGKTETIRRFVAGHPEINMEIVSLYELVKRCPFPMGVSQTLEGSWWMVKEVEPLCQKDIGEVQVFDRTPVDILAYTIYAEERTGSEDANILERILELCGYFDVLFYLAVSNEWPIEAYASARDIEFAREMDSYIRRAIERLGVNVVSLPWDLGERERLLCEHLGSSLVA